MSRLRAEAPLGLVLSAGGIYVCPEGVSPGALRGNAGTRGKVGFGHGRLFVRKYFIKSTDVWCKFYPPGR